MTVKPENNTARANNTQRTVFKLLAIVVGMFGFGFLLVPLYDVFCDITGLNGKTGGKYGAVQASQQRVDETREITIQFLTNNNDGMGWDFHPTVASIKVHPGKATHVNFLAKNTSKHVMTAQAIPSVTPFDASDYFHKTECFCFEQQTLTGGESIEMPLRFIVDQDLPKHIKTLTLAYTLFDVSHMTAKNN